MNIKDLVYITTVAEIKNISKAADKLFISQSSLSRCIQKIESDLGTELFKRTPDGLKLTMAGEYYVTSAETILETYREMENKFSHLNAMKSGRLVIGTTTYLGSFVLPSIISTFTNMYPSIRISLVEGVSMDIESEIIKGSVDLGILHTPVITPSLEQRLIAEERFLLAIPPDDYLNDHYTLCKESGKKCMDIRLTANRDYILTHTSQRTRQITDQILRRAGIDPPIKYTTRSIQTASRLVATGLGITLVPHSYCSIFSKDYSPRYYHLSDELNPTWSLVVCCNSESSLSKPAEELIRIAQETLPYLYKDRT